MSDHPLLDLAVGDALRRLADWSPEDVVLRGAKIVQNPAVDLRLVAEQLRLRLRAKAKLPTWAFDPRIRFPDATALEQASSEATAQLKRRWLFPTGEPQRLVDFSAGLGVDAQALLSACSSAVVVEPDPGRAELLAHNLRLFEPGKTIKVIQQAAETIEFNAQEFTASFVAMLDPDRRDNAAGRSHALADGSPPVRALLQRLPPSAERMLLKTSPMLDIWAALAELAELPAWTVTRLAVVAVGAECKEALYLLERNPSERPGVPAPLVEIIALGPRRTSLWQAPMSAFEVTAPTGSVGKFLFDPDPAFRKVNRFAPLCAAFGLRQIAPATNLLTGDQPVESFPGRCFKLCAPDRDGLSGAANDRQLRRAVTGRALSVVSRNHPSSADALRKRFRLKESERDFLFAFRGDDGRPQLRLGTRLSNHLGER
ncbi:MAG: hypothetical protein AAF648_15490 [Pseudomonadota bacterium]